jgi:quercetin dioxygenase-like cupin family protein/alkylhydroperoxidase/carboxymuconolactone decarboxylase family protein YurZ
MKKSAFALIMVMVFTFSACMHGTGIREEEAMNTQEHLDLRQQKIAAVAAATAGGDIDVLKVEIGRALDDGLTINEIKEVLVQMYAYCGFPRSLNGLGALMSVLEERKNKGIADTAGREAAPVSAGTDKYERGKKILETLTRRPEPDPKTGVNAFSPETDVFLKEHLFAGIFERDVLSFQDRELATISALAAMEGTASQLQAHRFMGLNAGLTQTQLDELTIIAEGLKPHLFPKGNRGPSVWFTGFVYVQPLVNPQEMENLYSVGNVSFEAGARTHWHTHPIGQTLLVTEGRGWYQERGQPAKPLVKGSVVAIPKDVEHWHGAAKDSPMVHLAISNMKDGSNVTWLAPVTDEEYKEAAQ